MHRFSSIFSQLLQLFPRLEFEQAVKRHRSDYAAKGFTSWGQFVAMLFCQFGRAHSLREICGGLASCEGKVKHLGVSDSPKRSTLAYANANRPWSLFQTVFEQLLAKCQVATASRGIRKRFRFKNKLVSPDASIIDLSLSLFAADVDIRVVLVESGGAAAPPAVRLPRFVRLVEPTLRRSSAIGSCGQSPAVAGDYVVVGQHPMGSHAGNIANTRNANEGFG